MTAGVALGGAAVAAAAATAAELVGAAAVGPAGLCLGCLLTLPDVVLPCSLDLALPRRAAIMRPFGDGNANSAAFLGVLAWQQQGLWRPAATAAACDVHGWAPGLSMPYVC